MPDPPTDAVPVHDVARVTIPDGSRASVTFEPEQSGSVFQVPTLAVTKFQDTTYQVETDGTTRYAQAPVPPTDVDDLGQTFYPPLPFQDSLTVTIRNVGSNQRTYTTQLIGWEQDPPEVF